MAWEYMIVLKLHDGTWHCITGGSWDDCLVIFRSTLATLEATDYYAMVSPEEVKIIIGDTLPDGYAVAEPMDAVKAHNRLAMAEDERDIQHIKSEWEQFDRDPPGS